MAAAALDVLEKEPNFEVEKQDYYNPLLELDNVVITPHLGASTQEAQVNVAVSVAREVAAVLKGGIAKNAVNLPAFEKENLMRLCHT